MQVRLICALQKLTDMTDMTKRISSLLPLSFIMLVAYMAWSEVGAYAKQTAVRAAGTARKSDKAAALQDLQQKALKTYMTRNYPEACKLFKECVQQRPGDTSLQYYLGASALAANDIDTAEHALCRVVVMSPANSEFNKLALKTLKDWRQQFHSIQPYSQFEGRGLLRWDKSKGPIKVWVSNGLQLPRGYSGPELTVEKCRALYAQFDRPGFFERLVSVDHYVPQYQQIVKEGINDWAWVAAEGIVKFVFVEDPRKADVLYFWCLKSGGDSVGRTFYPWSTARARCIVHVETEYLREWGARVPKELRKTSAHEFGHVLGLRQHSNSDDDVMCGHGRMVKWREMSQYSTESPVTRNDFVTLRALYELPAEDLFEPLPDK